MRKCLICVLSAFLLGACAPVWKKPELSLLELRLVGGNILQQNVRLYLRVTNPNGMDIEVEDLFFDLLVAESKLGGGQLRSPTKIPMRGEGVLELDAKLSLLGVLGRLPELTAADDKLHYRIKGDAQISRYGRVPFDQAGELELSKLKGARLSSRAASTMRDAALP